MAITLTRSISLSLKPVDCVPGRATSPAPPLDRLELRDQRLRALAQRFLTVVEPFLHIRELTFQEPDAIHRPIERRELAEKPL
ncbi:hypothetical protein NKJ09_28385 [Mesorhizobium sp. M0189]|uniref:hypothetical protein n=1 Tax=Mesorhizobium sp. M0189 TaxID=2956909 RepID=UPI003336B850